MLVDCRFENPILRERRVEEDYSTSTTSACSSSFSYFSLETNVSRPPQTPTPQVATTICASFATPVDVLEQREEVYQKDYWEMVYDGPRKFRDSRRFPDEDSIEVRFGILKPSDCLGDWKGTAPRTAATGSIMDLSSRKRKSSMKGSKIPKKQANNSSSEGPSSRGDDLCLCSSSILAVQQVTVEAESHFLSMSRNELPRKRSVLLRHIRDCAEKCGRWRICCGGSHCEADFRPDWKVLKLLEEHDIVHLQNEFPYAIDFPFLQKLPNDERF